MDDLRYVAANYNIELYQVKAERIQGESNCMVKLPCKYEGKSLALLVGAIPDTGQ